MIEASAPAKIILFGEHAVVYGQPAIAAPVMSLRATATVEPDAAVRGLWLRLPDLGHAAPVKPQDNDEPLAHVAALAVTALGLEPWPDWTVTLRSTIPLASGLGSGAAAATAIVRALAAAAGQALSPATVSALVYESEKRFHGSPSGVDNTVIAYGQPVWFVRGQPPQPFAVAGPLTLVVGDTGIASPTAAAVGDVRRGWQAEPERFERLFDAVGRIVRAARRAVEGGDIAEAGRLMDDNHRLLQEIGVSSPELDGLCTAARQAGALGAKLSGGGRGGNMLALAQPAQAAGIAAALRAAGARQTFVTTLDA